jgi:hypothetical protein
VFLELGSQQYYVLLAGRWYRGSSLEGPWVYVRADALPGGFARIPTDSPKVDVLAFVAGTPQAEDAVLDAMVPQTGCGRSLSGR